MDVNVDGLSVRFPFTGLYPEQYQLMVEAKRALDGMAHSMLQVSAGAGERLAVLAVVLAYRDAHPGKHQ
jgi:DNA excision repair protein ERCC-2